MQTQPTRQISQTPTPVSQIQAQISQTSWSTPSSRTVSEFNRLFHPYRKNSPSSGNSSTGRRKSTQMRQVTFTVFCLGRKDTKNVSATEEKVEMFLAGLGEKRVTFPFTDSKVEFIETENYVGELYHFERYQIRCFSCRKECEGDGVCLATTDWIQRNIS